MSRVNLLVEGIGIVTFVPWITGPGNVPPAKTDLFQWSDIRSIRSQRVDNVRTLETIWTDDLIHDG